MFVHIDLEERKEPTPMTGHTKIADPLPKRGGAIQLVHYFPTRDGWSSEIVQGKYLSATTSTIRIRRDDRTVELDRGQWAVCIAEPSPEPEPAEDAPQSAPDPVSDPDAPPPSCPAVRTRFVDDPDVVDIRPVGSHGSQRAGTRKCGQCGAVVTVTQRLAGGEPASAWLYEAHTVPREDPTQEMESATT
ncbi:hypothetical protein [Leifsonia sp. TF02-11]|uniref:hypothetical protein n=1 Tax=Leifsonia sp. TF02-11 TaxID=2815212 RepID=UPI001AA1446F|nr:hypothetical protein [Leifsonia sp. TF02-11]MBO1741035.1 hypothetical protein [Leifsonia sp. TF02-11]